MVRSEAQKLRQKIKRPILVVEETRVSWKGQKGQMKIFFFNVEKTVDFRVARRENLLASRFQSGTDPGIESSGLERAGDRW